MLSLKLAANPRRPTLAPPPTVRKRIKPPALKLLPRRTYTQGILLSSLLHTILIAALIWLPKLFPSPVVMEAYDHRKTEVASAYEPLVLPLLPRLSASDSGSMRSAAHAPQTRSSAADDNAPLKRGYAGPQEIISDFPHATNRVQTIRRPDLVSPPELKFPLRLQSVVVLPAPAAPRFAPRRTEVQIPIPAATVELPKLVSVPEPVSAIPSEPASAQSIVQPTVVSSPVVELGATPRKAVIVVNAVSVAPDPSIQIPDAQLSGSFVVGPSLGTASPAKSSAGDGKSGEPTPAKNSANASTSYKGTSTGADTNKGTGTNGSSSTRAGSSDTAGTGPNIGIATGNGTGSSGGTSGPGSGNSASSGKANTRGAGGISSSGGSPGRMGASASRTVPPSRSYGMTIISGGSSGGAGRDMGVFDRSETVFSVAIPMGDAGGGPDWPMQYALKNRTSSGTGLLVPPFAQKKIAATMARAQGASEQGPIFITGTIDETGKLQSLRSIRTQDARSQPAIHALQQWEFLPAQLDGRPVASKVLIGVTVIEE
ncbi:MAG TPA: energy transducer TonB [Candidatus Angelobacter sp.]|nr:energy transducer TonB [Candidatus Angelobacter sp.]